jgi:hypothetical protein
MSRMVFPVLGVARSPVVSSLPDGPGNNQQFFNPRSRLLGMKTLVVVALFVKLILTDHESRSLDPQVKIE